MPTDSPAAGFLAQHRERISIDPAGCWLWQGYVRPDGYAAYGKPRRFAHRLAFEAFRGPVPEGLELDHLCRVRSCVNPAHLEAVTHRENLSRGPSTNWIPARTGACLRGHRRTEGTSYRTPAGAVQCRICRRETEQRYRTRHQEELRERWRLAQRVRREDPTHG